jgi:acetyl-CoA acetyltransferase
MSALLSGLDYHVPGETVNTGASGLSATNAARAIQVGDADLMISDVENMTRGH